MGYWDALEGGTPFSMCPTTADTPPSLFIENCPGHGKTLEHKGRAGNLLHKGELPDLEMMEVLI